MTYFSRQMSPAGTAITTSSSSLPRLDGDPSRPAFTAPGTTFAAVPAERIPADRLPDHLPQLRELDLAFESGQGVLWQYMKPESRPSFTQSLLDDMNAALDFVARHCHGSTVDDLPIGYLVLASRLPGVFNLGGDLSLFMAAIEDGDAMRLRRYAHACIAIQYRRAVNLDLPLCTIALVQGDALGGGFEAALAHDVIVAERSAKFGLPEVLFNLFPGMGAYSFLSRRLNPAQAERMILSGRVYTADELYDLGIVDKVVEDGAGEQGVYEFIRSIERARRAWGAVTTARRLVNPITREELLAVVDLWVDTALTLSPTDLRKMKHLVAAQDRRWARMRPN